MTDHIVDANKKVSPCPVCGTVPKYSSTVVDYRGSITCILLVPLCTCLINARRIGGEISTNQWDQLCSEYLGRACREWGIETVEQVRELVGIACDACDERTVRATNRAENLVPLLRRRAGEGWR